MKTQSRLGTLKDIPTNKILRLVIDEMSDGVVVCDHRGNFLLFNPAAKRILGQGGSDSPPLEWSDVYGIYHADGITPYPPVQLPLARAMRGEQVDDARLFIRNAHRKEGVWISVDARPLKVGTSRRYGGIAVFRDISERQKAEQEIVEISGREQLRLGQELHDGLCQTLLGTKFLLRLLERHAKRKFPGALAALREIQYQIGASLTQADGVARGLFPVELEQNGLRSALEELVRKIRKQYAVDCQFKCGGEIALEDSSAATHLYRIAQEAVINAVKGGKSSSVRISLDHHGQYIRLRVTDNGCGFRKGRQRNGMGLRIMAYRARMIDAELAIESLPSKGTIVRCDVPTIRRSPVS